MFLQYFGYVSRPLGEMERLLADLTDRLQGWAEGSYREGESLMVRLGGSKVVAKTVKLTVGEPVRGDTFARVPLSWEATGTPGLFPTMTADLVLARLDSDLTQVKFEGSYEPPLGVVGRLLDQAVLHRVAEVSVKKLVDRIIEALESNGATTAGEAAAPSQG